MNSDGTVSWRELFDEAAQRLGAAGLDGARSDARRIVEEASGASPTELLTRLEQPASERGVAHFDSMLQRRMAGEPLQYVLGCWSFRTLDLMVDRRVLIPRPETESVVEFALAELDSIGAGDRSTTVVDMGTGSGAIGLSIAVERVRTTVWLTDISSDALSVAQANIAGLGRSGARVRTSAGSWFEALPDELMGSIDLVISNPPYVADSVDLPDEVSMWEPNTALRAGPDGLDDLRTIIAGTPEWITDAGILVCEISPEQADAVEQIARNLFAGVEIKADLTGRHRALVARHPFR